MAAIEETTSTKVTLLTAANALLLVGTLAANGLASAGVLTDYDVGEVSRLYQTPITPNSFAFSIWGIIYAGLSSMVLWHLTCLDTCLRRKPGTPAAVHRNETVLRIGWWFAASCVINAVWLVVFVRGTVAAVTTSTFLLLLLAGSLTIITGKLQAFVRFVEIVAAAPSPSDQSPRLRGGQAIALPIWYKIFDAIIVDGSLSIYLGWTISASILNIVVAATALGWTDSASPAISEVFFAHVPVVIGAILFIVLMWRERNFVAPLSFVWATIAIFANKGECVALATGYEAESCARIATTAICCGSVVGVVAATTFVQFLRLTLIKPVEEPKPASSE